MLNVLTKKIVGFILFSGVKIIPVIEGHKVFSFYVRRRKLENVSYCCDMGNQSRPAHIRRTFVGLSAKN